jgi:type IV pilus assembly protein PilA
MKKSAKKKKKGFTLIELLIVVAIIAILAAIAIPQFSAYRIKGYNAAASSDIRNAKTAEEALFADYQGYGDSTVGGPIFTTGPVILTTKDTSGNTRTIQVGLSNGVQMAAKTDVNDATAGTNYLIFSKHKQGDRMFAADGNTTTLYWLNESAGNNLTVPSYASTSNSDITGAGMTAM